MMRYQSLLLLLGLWAAGCSSSTTPSSPAPPTPGPIPEAASRTEVTPSSSTSPTSPAPALPLPPIPGNLHQLDPSQHQPTRQPVVGRLLGQDFRPKHVLFNANRLTFRTGDDLFADQEMTLQLLTNANVNILPLRTVIDPNKPNAGGELVLVSLSKRKSKDSLPESIDFMGKFALTLELTARQNGKVKGHIHLSLDDETKTALEGTFEAIWQRPFGGPLDADEVPYFQATLPVPPKTQIINFGYISDAAAMDGLRCSLQFDLSKLKPGSRLGSGSGDLTGRGDIQASYDQETITFDAGRLIPGRYLIWARLPDGPMTFNWVDVTPTSQAKVTLNLSSETGTVEVKTKTNDAGKVTLTPAEPNPMSTAEFSPSRYFPLRAEGSFRDGKATVTGLPPGKYRLEVWKPQGPQSWTGITSQMIEVKAGPQVIELKP